MAIGDTNVEPETEPKAETPKFDEAELIEKYRTQLIAGGNKLTPELIRKIRHSWGIEGLSRDEIAHTYGVGNAVVSDVVKGIGKGPNPGSRVNVQQLVPRGLSAQELKPLETPSYREPVNLPSPALSVETLGKLFYLAIGSGFENLDDFVERELIPWYGVKADWQTKTHSRMSPRELGGVFEIMARKAVKFDSLAQEAITPE